MDPDDQPMFGPIDEGGDHVVDPRTDAGKGRIATDHRGVPGQVGEQNRQPPTACADPTLVEGPELVEGPPLPTLVEVRIELLLFVVVERTRDARPRRGEVVEPGRAVTAEDQRLLEEGALV